MNLMVVGQFFETTYISIFKHFLTAGLTKKGLLGLVSIYYGTIETNGQEILYLHYLILLRRTFYFAYLRNEL